VRCQRALKAVITGKKITGNTLPGTPLLALEDFSKRRHACNKCQACTNPIDCYQCSNCAIRLQYKDVGKVCVMRECMAPLLMSNSICSECGLDGWGETATNFNRTRTSESNLMECSLCWSIVHPNCIFAKVNPKTIGIVNDDLPNSWECPICLEKTSPSRPMKRHKSTEEKGQNNNSTNINEFNSNSGVNHEISNGNNSLSFSGGSEGSRIPYFGSKIKEEQIETKLPMINKLVRQ